MRLSKVLSKAARKAVKGKSVEKEIDVIVQTIATAIENYSGKPAGVVLESNKDTTFESVRGCVPLSVLDEESLIAIIQKEHSGIIIDTCETSQNENYELNAELNRAVATNSLLLAATYWLAITDSEEDSLL